MWQGCRESQRSYPGRPVVRLTSNSDSDVRLRRQGSAEAIVPRVFFPGRAEHREDQYDEQFAGRTKKAECFGERHYCANEMGEACRSCAEGRAVLGTRQRKIQRKNFCVILGEPPDADPHVRWCERERLAAAPYSIELHHPDAFGRN